MYPYTQRVDTSCPHAAVLSRGKRTRVHGNMGTDLLRDADRQEDDGGYASLAGGGGYIPRYIYDLLMAPGAEVKGC